MVLTMSGAFDKAMITEEKLKSFLPLGPPPAHDSFFKLLYRLWLNFYWMLTAIYPIEVDTGMGPYYTYDDHQWSIPVEFYSSMAMLGTLFALSWLRTIWRISFAMSAYLFLYMTGRGRCATFVFGLLLAEIEAAIQAYHQESPLKLSDTNETQESRSLASGDSLLGQRLLGSMASLPEKTVNILGFITLLIGITLATSP